jgi:hypothetical protein
MAGNKYMSAIGHSYHLSDRKAAVQSAINCYPQKVDQDNFNMVSAPGHVRIASYGAPIRGSRYVAGKWFIVAGDKLYQQNENGTNSLIFTGIDGLEFVGMAHNRTQLCMVTGQGLYILNLEAMVCVRVNSAAFTGSHDVHEMDGYFIFVDPASEQFYISAIDDGTTLDALDFSSADSSPDDIVTHRVSHRQAWFFGVDSTEIWVNSGAAAFPLLRYQSYTLDVGCVGKRAAIVAADTLFWIGGTRRGDGIVYMAAGNQPQRVSNLAVEEALKTSADLSAAVMWCYQIEGHEFIGLSAPGMATTWVYDAAMQSWHERGEWADQWKPMRSSFVTSINGKQYSCNTDGTITRLSASVNNIDGRVLVRERTWPHMISQALEPMVYTSLELSMATGQGHGNVTLEISNDGGYTFGARLLRSLGATGRFMQRVRWLGLGSSFNRVFRIRCSDDVPFTIYSASVEAS